MTSKDVLDAIEAAYHPRDKDWLFLRELRLATGYRFTEQRVDGFAMHFWPSRHFERVIYEVKVSRSDFMAELRQPKKREIALRYAHRFYFVSPNGVIPLSLVPDDCGLIYVDERGPRIAKEPVKLGPRTPPEAPPIWMTAAIARAALREGVRRGAGGVKR